MGRIGGSLEEVIERIWVMPIARRRGRSSSALRLRAVSWGVWMMVGCGVDLLAQEEVREDFVDCVGLDPNRKRGKGRRRHRSYRGWVGGHCRRFRRVAPDVEVSVRWRTEAT